MKDELLDRFGDIPRKVDTLLEISLLKALAHSAYVTAVEQKGEAYEFVMYEKAPVLPERIPALVESFRGELSFRADSEHPGFTYRKKRKGGAEKNADSLEIVKKVLIGIKGLIDH